MYLVPEVSYAIAPSAIATTVTSTSRSLTITEVVQQAFTLGYLTITAEDQLRALLRQHYGKTDFEAFMRLQAAAMAGEVRQESRDHKPLAAAD